MEALEARVRCLELAAQFTRASGSHDENRVVEIATIFYNGISSPEPVSEAAPAARQQVVKPKRDKPADILS